MERLEFRRSREKELIIGWNEVMMVWARAVEMERSGHIYLVFNRSSGTC